MHPWKGSDFVRSFGEIFGDWSQELRGASLSVIARIKVLLRNGVPLTKAISAALSESDYFGKMREALAMAIFRAAAAGYGFDPPNIDAPQKAIIVQKLMTLPWAPDRINLSTRLHGADAAIQGKIYQIINQSMHDGANWINLARQLFDGYNSQHGPAGIAKLPDYIDNLANLARRALDGDPIALAEYLKTLKYAARRTATLAANDAPNTALKTAYKELLTATIKGNEKAIDRAVYRAIMEKSRYFAERIARTEIARAWSDGFFTEHQDDPDVVAYRWRLSSRHPIQDICDFHAHADLYGLGPGIYPKDRVPKYPAHPHCLCHFEPVFNGELDGLVLRNDDAFIRQSGREWLLDQSRDVREMLLGREGAREVDRGADWRQYLRGWEGHVNPDPRLSPRDFGKVTPPALPTPTPASIITPQSSAPVTGSSIKSGLPSIKTTDPIDDAFPQVPDAWRQEMTAVLKQQSPELQRITLAEQSRMTFELVRGTGSSCSGYHVRLDDTMAPHHRPHVFYHEYGHFMDKRMLSRIRGNDTTWQYISDQQEFHDAVEKDKKLWSRRTEKTRAFRDALVDQVAKPGAPFYNHRAISDLFCSASRTSIEGAWGHSESYYREASHRANAEIFAQLWSIYARNDEAAKNLLRKFMPSTVDHFESLVDRVNKII